MPISPLMDPQKLGDEEGLSTHQIALKRHTELEQAQRDPKRYRRSLHSPHPGLIQLTNETCPSVAQHTPCCCN